VTTPKGRFKGKTPIVFDMTLIGNRPPTVREKMERILGWLDAHPGAFQGWRAVILTDHGIYDETNVIHFDRKETPGGGFVHVQFRPMEARKAVRIDALLVFDSQRRFVGMNRYEGYQLRAGDLLNLTYTMNF
jgi:hypothetical protein